jgi:hypothetical protein
MPLQKKVEYSIDREFDEYLRGRTMSKVLDESLSEGTLMSSSWLSKGSNSYDTLAYHSLLLNRNSFDSANDNSGNPIVENSIEKRYAIQNERCPASPPNNESFQEESSTPGTNCVINKINNILKGKAATNPLELINRPLMMNNRDEPTIDDDEILSNSQYSDMGINAHQAIDPCNISEFKLSKEINPKFLANHLETENINARVRNNIPCTFLDYTDDNFFLHSSKFQFKANISSNGD